jgi:HPr kinase/phosphorylase
MAEAAAAATVHAGCVLLGEGGVLILGPAGAGKSSLARELIDAARLAGTFARLVSDDRTLIEAFHGRLVARPVAPLEGLIEARGVGLLRESHEGAALVRLAVELSTDEPPRFPEDSERRLCLCGVEIPRLFMRRGAPLIGVLLERMRCIGDSLVTR